MIFGYLVAAQAGPPPSLAGVLVFGLTYVISIGGIYTADRWLNWQGKTAQLLEGE